MGVISVTRSYEYSVLCDVCQFKKKASELRTRWDGLQVCNECWEPRHPSDFYRPRNDVHKLPFTRSDDAGGLTWTLTTANLTSAAAARESTSTSYIRTSYMVNGTSGNTTGAATIVEWRDSNDLLTVWSQPKSVTSSTGITITLPTTPGSAGTIRYMTSNGEFLGTAVISAGNATTGTGPIWSGKPGHLNCMFTYGT